MNATQEQVVTLDAMPEQVVATRLPELAVPTPIQAMKLVNRWLQSEIGMAVSASQAYFNAANYCWHLPIHLAYGSTGPLGVIGDVYLHAATGEFIGRPTIKELHERAMALAKVHGLTEED